MTINEELLRFLDASVTPFHAVEQIRGILKENGYEELSEAEGWKLKEGGRYFVVRNGASLIGFRIPRMDFTGFMIGASHTDSPNFRVKENPEIVSDGYVRLNVEGYGGMLCAPWFDRPLSLAGRVVVKKDETIRTELISVDRDLMMIPSLAIHMDREVNSGHTYNVQKEMLPIIGSDSQKGIFQKLLAEETGTDEILGYDLMLYIRQKGTVWGAENEYISAPRLDDLQCTFADLKGFLAADPSDAVPVLALFDNEEVGSRTNHGADSTFLEDVLKRIASVCGNGPEEYMRLTADSFMVSADNAHALHPSYTEKADPSNRPKINGGIVLKFSAPLRYTTDGIAAALFREVCRQADVPCQTFANRSDMRGGATLGNISNSHVSLITVDIGLPQLAMHSPYETAGTADTEYLMRAMKEFFSSALKNRGQGEYSLTKQNG